MPSDQQKSNTPPEERDYWQTPGWLVAFLRDRFGAFDVDLACTAANMICERGIVEERDSLSENWRHWGRLGFLNPPFSNPGPWVQKAVDSATQYERDGFSCVLVLPTHVCQKWAALAALATERIEFEGRINYVRPGGGKSQSNRGGTQVLYFRQNDLGNTRTVWLKTADLRKKWDPSFGRQRRAYARAHREVLK